MKILVLCARVPYPLTDGESLRVFTYAKHLSARHDLDLVCVGDPGSVDPAVHTVFRRVEVFAPTASGGLERRPVRRVIEAFRVESLYKFYPDVAAHLNQVVAERLYDVIWTSTDLATCVPHDCGVPVLTDVCDDGVLLLQRELAKAKGIIEKLRLWKRLRMTKRFERRYFGRTAACLFVSEEDAETFRSFSPESRTEVIPNGVDTEYFQPRVGVEEAATLVFEGSMYFTYNADAAVYFCRVVLPLILAHKPEVRVLIVGRDPTPEVRRLASDTVTVTGRVDDIRPYVARGALFVCPMRMGSGIKNKILQAWSMEKAVVATPVSLGGLEYEDGGNIVVAGTAQGFADAVLELLGDPERRAHLGRNARSTVLRGYRWQARALQFESVLKSLLLPSASRLAKPDQSPLGRAA